MADLFIDMAALARTERTLTDIGAAMTGPADAMAAVPTDVTGHAGLQAKLRSFGDGWEHGIRELSRAAAEGAAALVTIRSAFAEVDAQLAASLRGEG